MKIKFNSALKAGVVAAALAFSGASQATEFVYTSVTEQIIAFADARSFDVATSHDEDTIGVGISIYTMINKTNASQQFLAFCIQPEVDVNGTATYKSNSGVQVDDKIKRLYESSYAGLNGNMQKQMAFQLALWDLMYDDGNMYNTVTSTGAAKQYFNGGTDGTYVEDAAQMLLAASTQSIHNMYNYTTFTSLNGVTTQELMAVTAAVPETETWAMLAAGLGLVGFMGRRKSRQTEKFAA
jgi:hypothetical protein